jgi:hypothetical protein
MAQPLINGVEYGDFAQIRLNVLGREVVGITAISYSDEEDMKDNYGQGKYVVSRSTGQVKCEASITLLVSEVEALQVASPTGRIQDIPTFDIPVSYVNFEDVLVTHVIHNCRFKKNSRSAKTGDMGQEVELPLLVSHISWK